jgi:hypothetical protein
MYRGKGIAMYKLIFTGALLALLITPASAKTRDGGWMSLACGLWRTDDGQAHVKTARSNFHGLPTPEAAEADAIAECEKKVTGPEFFDDQTNSQDVNSGSDVAASHNCKPAVTFDSGCNMVVIGIKYLENKTSQTVCFVGDEAKIACEEAGFTRCQQSGGGCTKQLDDSGKRIPGLLIIKRIDMPN